MTATRDSVIMPAINEAISAMRAMQEAFMDPDCGESKAEDAMDRLKIARVRLDAAKDYLK